ncbi:hypothetical protein EA473_03335 [Natrarchaeobius chitinivorans]|uniref:Uncharacterized protein n=2 Tax=Natrarchaeobius chitinivorans TaxID=1679083 RepID=A0A3N6MM40_NATCH|nr:hypothetical protein EA473_03335 [Natrarchaeobius chitinivorans]
MPVEAVPVRMFRAILPEGQIVCERYDHAEKGLELYDEDDEFIAFVPYANLHALVNEEVYGGDERSIM